MADIEVNGNRVKWHKAVWAENGLSLPGFFYRKAHNHEMDLQGETIRDTQRRKAG